MTMSNWIWEPSQSFMEATNVYRFMHRLGFTNREEFLRFSGEEPEVFWDRIVKEVGIKWFTPYERVMDASRGPEWARWFINGKLNIAWNCLDRHAEGPAARRIACIGESENGAVRALTFADVFADSSRLAHAMQRLGLKKGDRAAIFLPMIPEVAVILYACFKLGLIVVPVFSGFGPVALSTRLQASGARIVFTADSAERRGKVIELKATVDQALQNGSSVEKVITCRQRGVKPPWNSSRDTWWDDFLNGQPRTCESLPLDSEDIALIVYTSGTTGKPKGTVHTHAGFLAKVTGEIYLAFDHQQDDRFFWLSDIGWLMGSWTIVANHHFGGTVLLYDGAPDYPRADRLWEMIERHRLTSFCASPTTIRLVMRKDAGAVAGHNLSSLRILGSTGEPWDENSYRWFFDYVGKQRCPIINISGGTEVAGSFVSVLPIQPLKPCSLGGPAPGMAVEVFDENGHPTRREQGHLVCTNPAPSMTRGLWNDPEGYLAAYWSRWSGIWNHGDWASVDDDGQWFVHGRADDSFNVAGRKIGPAEIEQVIFKHEAISEAAVVGVPDEITGESIVAFVVLKTGMTASSELAEQLLASVAAALGPTLRPRTIQFVEDLPKTQSGKIIRRALRQIYLGSETADNSTVEDPAAVRNLPSPFQH